VSVSKNRSAERGIVWRPVGLSRGQSRIWLLSGHSGGKPGALQSGKLSVSKGGEEGSDCICVKRFSCTECDTSAQSAVPPPGTPKAGTVGIKRVKDDSQPRG